MKPVAWMCALALLVGCSSSQDPGDGGFFAGVTAIGDGTYSARISGREAAVEAGQIKHEKLEAQQRGLEAESAATSTELERLTTEHNRIKRRIVALRSDLVAKRIQLDQPTKARLTKTIADTGGSADAQSDRVKSLRRAIREARALADELVRISS